MPCRAAHHLAAPPLLYEEKGRTQEDSGGTFLLFLFAVLCINKVESIVPIRSEWLWLWLSK